MNLAILNNERVTATPGSIGFCPLCKEEVIAKCGSIKVWHWSHKSNTDCDKWGEGETQWHLDWKNEFPKEQQEVVIEEHWNNKHRADIFTKQNIIIELQNSPISKEEISERETFYKNMIWLLNGKNLWAGMRLRVNKERNIITFRWKYPAQSWWMNTKPIYYDLNYIKEPLSPFYKKILLIKKIYPNLPCGGWGILMTKEEFLKQFR